MKVDLSKLNTVERPKLLMLRTACKKRQIQPFPDPKTCILCSSFRSERTYYREGRKGGLLCSRCPAGSKLTPIKIKNEDLNTNGRYAEWTSSICTHYSALYFYVSKSGASKFLKEVVKEIETNI